MVIKCNFNARLYDTKPSEVAIVQQELSTPIEIELSTLAKALGNGANFRPAAINGTKSSGFISQQIFAIDIDNEVRDHGHMQALPLESQLTPEKAIDMAKKNGYSPVFGYHTHSWKHELEKFRLVFVMDKPVTSDSDRDTILAAIMRPFLQVAGWTDSVVKDKARIFFGGHDGLLMYEESNVIALSKILSDKSNLPEEKKIKKSTGRTSSPSHMQEDVSYDILTALRNHDVNFFTNRLHFPPITFASRQELYNWILHSLPLDQLLGVQQTCNFRCILHDDHHPSANIFLDKHGIWRYHCFAASCNADYNAKELIEKIGEFKSEYDAVIFICRIFNLHIKETEQMIRQKENLDLIIHHMYSTDEDAFSVLCPTADKNTRIAKSTFLSILNLARQTISPEGLKAEPGAILFYLSLEQLMQLCHSSSKPTINRRLKVLIYHKMIEAVPDQDLPTEALAAALRNRKSPEHNHISYYKIPSYVVEQLQLIESRGKSWEAHGYRAASICYELVYREDPRIAAEMYPQTKDVKVRDAIVQRKPTDRQEKIYGLVMQITIDLIMDQGYATEKQIVDLLCQKGYRYRTAKQAVMRDIADICDSNLLKKVRATKDVKGLLGIDCKGYPIIIIRQ